MYQKEHYSTQSELISNSPPLKLYNITTINLALAFFCRELHSSSFSFHQDDITGLIYIPVCLIELTGDMTEITKRIIEDIGNT